MLAQLESYLGSCATAAGSPAAPPLSWMTPQTCLSDQLQDLQAADMARVQAGKVPLYMVTRYTYGSESMVSGVRQWETTRRQGEGGGR